MADEEAVEPVEAPRGYVVDPNFRPRPQDRLGSLRTDGIGIPGRDITKLSPAFDVANRRSLLTAQQALVGNPAVNPTQINVEDSVHKEDVLERVVHKLEAIAGEITSADREVVKTTRQPFPPVTFNPEDKVAL